jgi:hypothetical protein
MNDSKHTELKPCIDVSSWITLCWVRGRRERSLQFPHYGSRPNSSVAMLKPVNLRRRFPTPVRSHTDLLTTGPDTKVLPMGSRNLHSAARSLGTEQWPMTGSAS